MTEIELAQRIALRPRKLLVSKPKLIGTQSETRTRGGIWKPATTNRGRREWGYLCRVHRVGNEVLSEGIVPGSIVLISEFAGMPLWYCGTEMNLWMVALGDVVGVVEDVEGEGLEIDNDPCIAT